MCLIIKRRTLFKLYTSWLFIAANFIKEKFCNLIAKKEDFDFFISWRGIKNAIKSKRMEDGMKKFAIIALNN